MKNFLRVILLSVMLAGFLNPAFASPPQLEILGMSPSTALDYHCVGRQ